MIVDTRTSWRITLQLIFIFKLSSATVIVSAYASSSVILSHVGKRLTKFLILESNTSISWVFSATLLEVTYIVLIHNEFIKYLDFQQRHNYSEDTKNSVSVSTTNRKHSTHLLSTSGVKNSSFWKTFLGQQKTIASLWES